MRAFVLLLLLGVATVGCDQAAKQAAVIHVKGGSGVDVLGTKWGNLSGTPASYRISVDGLAYVTNNNLSATGQSIHQAVLGSVTGLGRSNL